MLINPELCETESGHVFGRAPSDLGFLFWFHTSARRPYGEILMSLAPTRHIPHPHSRHCQGIVEARRLWMELSEEAQRARKLKNRELTRPDEKFLVDEMGHLTLKVFDRKSYDLIRTLKRPLLGARRGAALLDLFIWDLTGRLGEGTRSQQGAEHFAGIGTLCWTRVDAALRFNGAFFKHDCDARSYFGAHVHTRTGDYAIVLVTPYSMLFTLFYVHSALRLEFYNGLCMVLCTMGGVRSTKYGMQSTTHIPHCPMHDGLCPMHCVLCATRHVLRAKYCSLCYSLLAICESFNLLITSR